jgi:hypothetical protein
MWPMVPVPVEAQASRLAGARGGLELRERA